MTCKAHANSGRSHKSPRIGPSHPLRALPVLQKEEGGLPEALPPMSGPAGANPGCLAPGLDPSAARHSSEAVQPPASLLHPATASAPCPRPPSAPAQLLEGSECSGPPLSCGAPWVSATSSFSSSSRTSGASSGGCSMVDFPSAPRLQARS